MSNVIEEGIYPPALKKGDTVAIVAPSARLNHLLRGAVEQAEAWFKSQGFNTVEIYTHPLPTPFAAGLKKRAEELQNTFADPHVKALICAVGGSDANEILRFIDFDLIKRNPKIFIGYSDIAVLHFALFAKAGLRTFYGPGAISELAEMPHPQPLTSENFLHVLTEKNAKKPLGQVPFSKTYAPGILPMFTGGKPADPREVAANRPWRWVRSGTAKGRFMGGALSAIVHCLGTEYWPDWTGRILLLETSFAENYLKGPLISVTRGQLADLANVGVFEKISGIVIGRPYGMNEEETTELEKAVVDFLEVEIARGRTGDVPILSGPDLGHTSPMLTFPLNAMVELDSEKGKFEILEAGVV